MKKQDYLRSSIVEYDKNSPDCLRKVWVKIDEDGYQSYLIKCSSLLNYLERFDDDEVLISKTRWDENNIF